MKNTICAIIVLSLGVLNAAAADSPAIRGLLERISPGLSDRVVTEVVTESGDSADWFEIASREGKPLVSGNNAIAVATGINWYLKYYTGTHLCWGDMHAALPEVLPVPDKADRHTSSADMRYYLNYCTHSYSMAFWDWERWQEEIDWMALHGINMPLAITGTDTLWRNVLKRLGYPEDRIDGFIAGPGFQAWWLMNNLEGWGGPNTPEHYDAQEKLQKRIVGRMREFGMEPVFPGYAGMLPHDAAETLGLDVQDPGKWLSYKRPAFLQPENKEFSRIAAVYYDELDRLYGKTRYYSMDPFHEGGSTKGVNLANAGQAIMKAMKEHNPEAKWVIQAWRKNPRLEMISSLGKGDLVVLDLHAETEPIWNGRGFAGHDWLFCMLHNFGGNIGLYGRLETLASDYHRDLALSPDLRGVGLTMEGIETNPIVYEFMMELPWRKDSVDLDSWLSSYTKARYGTTNGAINEAWRLLGHSVYACPAGNTQQGTAESLFCARPADNPRQASSWAQYTPYYDPTAVAEAAHILVAQADSIVPNANYIYDMTDVVRQAVADRGRAVIARLNEAVQNGDKERYRAESRKFLRLIMLQDSLLATVDDFRVGTWINRARSAAPTAAEQDRYEWNARTQITTWGDRMAANRGKLHDYSHREWNGILADFYYPRWQKYFEWRLENWNAENPEPLDFFAIEEPWTRRHNPYPSHAEGDPVKVAAHVLAELELQ